MSALIISGDTSGTISLQAPAVAGSSTLSLPAVTSTVTTTNTVTGQAIGFVNKLRNGSFVVWPNGTSGSVTTSATGSSSITASGWAAIATGATITWSQVTTGSNGSPQSLKLTGATSVTDITLGQRIESYDAAPLAGQTCTFQITVTNNTGGSITPTIATRYAGSTDVWTSPVADLAATNPLRGTAARVARWAGGAVAPRAAWRLHAANAAGRSDRPAPDGGSQRCRSIALRSRIRCSCSPSAGDG